MREQARVVSCSDGKIILQEKKKNTVVFLFGLCSVTSVKHVHGYCLPAGNSLFYSRLKCQRAASLSLWWTECFRERTEDAGRSRIPSRVMRLHHSGTVHLRHNGILQQKTNRARGWSAPIISGLNVSFFATITSLTRMSGAFRGGTQRFPAQVLNSRDASAGWVHEVSMTSTAMSHF